MLSEGEYYWIKPREDSMLGSEWMIGRVTTREGSKGGVWFFVAGNEVEEPWGDFELGPKVIQHNELIVPARLLMEARESLRDQFAMAAITGLYASESATMDFGPSEVAADTYRIADAMMKAREGK